VRISGRSLTCCLARALSSRRRAMVDFHIGLSSEILPIDRPVALAGSLILILGLR